MFAQQIPCHAPQFFALEKHIEAAVLVCRADLPAFLVAEPFHRRPAAFIDDFAQRFGLPVRHHQPFARNGAHQVVELGLNRRQIRENVGVVVFQIVQNRGARAIVDKFAALVKKRGVVFVRLNHEKRRAVLRQAGGHAEILRHPANQEARAQSGIFQHPRQHGSRGGFAVRTGHAQHPVWLQHVFRQPLRAGSVRQVSVQNRFHHVHAALGNIANHIHIGRIVLQLRRIETFVHVHAHFGQLRAHRRIHFGIAARYLEARFFRQTCQAAHKRAANADNVDVLHGVFRVSQLKRAKL